MRILLLIVFFSISLNLAAEYQLDNNREYIPVLEDCNFYFFADIDNDSFNDIITIYDSRVSWIKSNYGVLYNEEYSLLTVDGTIEYASVYKSDITESIYLFLLINDINTMYEIDDAQINLLSTFPINTGRNVSSINVLREADDGLITLGVVSNRLILVYEQSSDGLISDIDSLECLSDISGYAFVNIDDDNDNEIIFSNGQGLIIADLIEGVHIEDSLISDSTLYESLSAEDINGDGVKEILAVKNGNINTFSATDTQNYQYSGTILDSYGHINTLNIVDFSGDGENDMVITHSDSVVTFIENHENLFVESFNLILNEWESLCGFSDLNNDGMFNPILSDFNGECLQYLVLSDTGNQDRFFIAGCRFDYSNVTVYSPISTNEKVVYFLHEGRVIRADIADSGLDFKLKPFLAENVSDFCISDIDGNGEADMAALLSTGNNEFSLVIEHDNNRKYLLNNNIELYEQTYMKLEFVDIDNDSECDLVIYNSQMEQISVYYNINGEFMGDREVVVVDNTSGKFSLADVNGDGLEDIIYFSSETSQDNSLQVSFNLDGISFSESVLIDNFLDFNSIHPADFNNDSIVDLLIVRNGRLYIRYGDRSVNGFQEHDNFVAFSDGLVSYPIVDIGDDDSNDILNVSYSNDGYMISVLENNYFGSLWEEYQIIDQNFTLEQEIVSTFGSYFDLLVFDSANGSISSGVFNEFAEVTDMSKIKGIEASCYPNPFNPEATIQYNIDKDCNIEINVYNIKGQKVKTLLDSFETKGKHSLNWNGTDDNERHVSSGIYFYRISTGRSTFNGKMLLVK